VVLVVWAVFAFFGAITHTSTSLYAKTIEEEVKIEPETYLGVSHSALVTGYNSLPEQTDDTPFITASGQRTRDGIVANNCLKFGSKVVIKGKIYEVQDRMNRRYKCNHYDIWMEHYDDAIKFGAQRLDVIKLID
jgi:3D (Asp-Asp-Asp) domain-containing protein